MSYKRVRTEARREYERKWRANNKEHIKILRTKQRSTIEGHCAATLGNIKKRQPNTTLTKEFLIKLWKYQEGKCAVTNKQMTLKKGNKMKSPTSPSLDKIIPNLKYIEENVRWVCDTVNMAKGAMSDNELKEWCKAIIKGLEEKT